MKSVLLNLIVRIILTLQFIFQAVVICHSQSTERNIVLVNVDTLDRKGIAEVINTINALNPKVIAIDLQFSTNTDSDADQRLMLALKNVKHLVMASVIDNYDGIKSQYEDFTLGSLPTYLTNAQTGFANTIYNGDSLPILKRFSVIENVNGKVEYHFAVRTAMVFDSLKTMQFVRDNAKVVNVNFQHVGFKKFSSDQILSNKIKRKDVVGKIVLIGFLGPGNADKFFTPLNSMKPPYTRDMYGLEYLACIVAQIIR